MITSYHQIGKLIRFPIVFRSICHYFRQLAHSMRDRYESAHTSHGRAYSLIRCSGKSLHCSCEYVDIPSKAEGKVRIFSEEEPILPSIVDIR